MDINNIQSTNPYTAARSAGIPANTTLPRDQNNESVETEQNRENAGPTRDAYQVNITQAAQDRLQNQERLETRDQKRVETMAQERVETRASEEKQAAAQETMASETDQNSGQPYKTSQIVNIVA